MVVVVEVVVMQCVLRCSASEVEEDEDEDDEEDDDEHDSSVDNTAVSSSRPVTAAAVCYEKNNRLLSQHRYLISLASYLLIIHAHYMITVVIIIAVIDYQMLHTHSCIKHSSSQTAIHF